MKIFNNKKTDYINIGFYLFFVPCIIILLPFERFISKDPYYFLLILAYFVIVHYTNRRFSSIDEILKGNYLRAILYFIITATVTYLISIINIKDIRTESSPSIEIVKSMRVRAILLVYFIDLSFNIMMGLTRELFRQRLNRERIEREKTKAEIAMYKSQINPHFMYNTLNTVYSLVVTGSDKAGDVLLKFTDLIKYMYSNSDKENITIGEELNYIKQFVELHTLRLGEQTKVNFSFKVDNPSWSIPPMLLITFVENAFKYGVSSTEQSQINISITLKDAVLNFESSNKIFVRNPNKGIGISNCRQRLDLLYPNAYSLECNEFEDNTFITKLIINP